MKTKKKKLTKEQAENFLLTETGRFNFEGFDAGELQDDNRFKTDGVFLYEKHSFYTVNGARIEWLSWGYLELSSK